MTTLPNNFAIQALALGWKEEASLVMQNEGNAVLYVNVKGRDGVDTWSTHLAENKNTLLDLTVSKLANVRNGRIASTGNLVVRNDLNEAVVFSDSSMVATALPGDSVVFSGDPQTTDVGILQVSQTWPKLPVNPVVRTEEGDAVQVEIDGQPCAKLEEGKINRLSETDKGLCLL